MRVVGSGDLTCLDGLGGIEEGTCQTLHVLWLEDLAGDGEGEVCGDGLDWRHCCGGVLCCLLWMLLSVVMCDVCWKGCVAMEWFGVAEIYVGC